MKKWLAAFAFLLFCSVAANAQGAPCQWNYQFNGEGQAVASYCGSVISSIPGLSNDFVHSDGPAVQSALNSASLNNGTGSTVILDPSKSYWTNQTIIVPPGVKLTCAAPIQKQHTQTQPSYTNDGCAIYFSAAAGTGIQNEGTVSGIRVYSDLVHFAGNLISPHQITQIVSEYFGTCVSQSGGYDAILEDVALAGCNLGILNNGINRSSIRHVLIEATNAYKDENIGDVYKNIDIEAFPFYSGNRTPIPGTGPYYFTSITGLSNVSGTWQVSYCNVNATGCGTAAAEQFKNGDEIFVSNNPGMGVNGKYDVENLNASNGTFQLYHNPTTPSVAAPSIGGFNITSGYVVFPVPAGGAGGTIADLWRGQTVSDSGGCIPAGAKVKDVFRQTGNIALDNAHAATCSNASDTLTFTNAAFSTANNPQVLYYPSTLHGTCMEFGGAGEFFSQVYCHDYDTAFQFDSAANSISIDQALCDAANTKWDLTRRCVWFNGNTFGNKLDFVYIASTGTAIYDSSSTAVGLKNTVEGNFSAGIIGSFLERANANSSLEIDRFSSIDGTPSSVSSNWGQDTFTDNIGFLQFRSVDLPYATLFRNVPITNDPIIPSQVLFDQTSVFGGLNSAPSLHGVFSGAIADPVTLGTSAGAVTCMPTSGGGTGATCANGGFSGSSYGLVALTAGTSAASSGSLTLTGFVFKGIANGKPFCQATLSDDTGENWPAGSTVRIGAVNSTSVVLNWFSPSTLTASTSYRINWSCPQS